MKWSIEYPGIAECFYASLQDHRNYGTTQQIRGTIRHEILDYTIELGNARQNVMFIPFRYMNMPAIIAETLWVFAGRNDMFFLKYYLKNARKYSDDDETWRGGYGRRLINYPAIDDDGNRIIVNKIDNLITYFHRDRMTTRGVLVMPDGSDYHLNEDDEEKLDEPCSMYVQYIHRGSELHCYVRMRSNDIILGCFNVNLFEWTFLQQLLANELHTAMGSYNVNAVSMHIYSDWMKKLPLMLNNQLPVNIYDMVEPTPLTITWTEFRKQINSLLELELLLRGDEFDSSEKLAKMIYERKLHPDMYDMMLVMMVTMAIKKKQFVILRSIFLGMKNKTWKIACLEYATRRLGFSFKGFMVSCFNETLKNAIGGHEEAVLNYILHSFTEQEAIDRLEGVRK